VNVEFVFPSFVDETQSADNNDYAEVDMPPVASTNRKSKNVPIRDGVVKFEPKGSEPMKMPADSGMVPMGMKESEISSATTPASEAPRNSESTIPAGPFKEVLEVSSIPTGTSDLIRRLEGELIVQQKPSKSEPSTDKARSSIVEEYWWRTTTASPITSKPYDVSKFYHVPKARKIPLKEKGKRIGSALCN